MWSFAKNAMRRIDKALVTDMCISDQEWAMKWMNRLLHGIAIIVFPIVYVQQDATIGYHAICLMGLICTLIFCPNWMLNTDSNVEWADSATVKAYVAAMAQLEKEEDEGQQIQKIGMWTQFKGWSASCGTCLCKLWRRPKPLSPKQQKLTECTHPPASQQQQKLTTKEKQA